MTRTRCLPSAKKDIGHFERSHCVSAKFQEFSVVFAIFVDNPLRSRVGPKSMLVIPVPKVFVSQSSTFPWLAASTARHLFRALCIIQSVYGIALRLTVPGYLDAG